MTVSITTTPNPTTRPATVDAVASGLTPGTRYNGRVDGSVIATKKALRNGTFPFGIAIGTTSSLGNHTVDIRDSSNKTTLATTTLVVAVASTAPSAPLNLSGVVGDTVVNLTWSAPSSNGGASVTGYSIYRNGVIVATSAGTTFTATGLTNGTAYAFAVSASNSVGEGPKSSTVNLTPVAPVIPPPNLKIVPVASIPDINKYLADNTVDVIDVANGTYHQDVAQSQTANSLWMGNTFASRTRPVIVQAHTDYGVTFDGGGGGNYGMWFGMGSHHQVWRGFQIANTVGGVIGFGGFVAVGSTDASMVPAHDITLYKTRILASCHRDSPTSNQRHAVYFANAWQRGPYNILIDDIEIQGTDSLCLWGGIHQDHGEVGNPAPDHVTIRNLKTTGLCYPIVLWSRTISDWTFDGATIDGPHSFPGVSGGNAIRYQADGTRILFKDIVSTNSEGGQGFYDDRGYTPASPPPGVIFQNCNLK